MDTDWESPLKMGQIITTEDGFTVQVVEPPHRAYLAYHVRVKVLSSLPKFHHLVGKIHIWEHQSPNKFLSSIIRTINGKRIRQGITVEEEFFQRALRRVLTQA